MVKVQVQPLGGRLRAGFAGIAIGAWTGFGALPLRAATLPAPCVSGVCGSNAPNGFLQSGQATAVQAGNTLTVTQTTNQAVLNWASFNISADGRVIFVQPSATSSALNRIFQASPSQIFGLLQANGNVYLVNQNGIIFGSTAQVNVGGLLASTLNLDPTLFQNGILSAPATVAGFPAPVLSSDGRTNVLDANGNVVLDANGQPIPVQIQVQAGAQITSNVPNGRILLAAQNIDNAGTISSPDGQVVLAAGQKVYLQASTDPTLRGLLVEVDSGGTVTNEVGGLVSADRGNVTLIGLAVNQLGRVSATTSVAANGSIRLVAEDTATFSSPNVLGALRGGSLTLGPQSQTTVLPDATDTATAVDAQVQLPSTLELDGNSIVLQGGSQIIAPSGQLTLTARANPSGAAPLASDPDGSRIHVDSGADIDLQGSVVSVPVTRNLVSVELNSNELADSPDQKNGALLGQTVVVDARADNGKGTAIANVTGALALTKRDILERTSTGGSVTFDSGGDVVVAQGATINVSGGAVDYTPGIMQTTRLITASGALVDIGSASESMTYVGVSNPTSKTSSDKWGVIDVVPTPGISYLDPGYVQGASAGSITVEAPAMVLNGTFTGTTVSGPYQRTPATAPLGGQFVVGNLASGSADNRAPAITLTSTPDIVVVSDTTTLPTGMTLDLPTDFLVHGGFTRIELVSNGPITIPAGLALDLAPNASLTLSAPDVVIDSSIASVGGSVNVSSRFGAFDQLGETTASLGISVGDNVTFDMRGNWTNDAASPLTQRPNSFIDLAGGSVTLDQAVQGGSLILGSNDSFEVSGGAWLPRSGSLAGGSGGSVVLNAGLDGSIAIGAGIQFDAYGVAGAPGGSLTLNVPRILISSGGSAWAGAQSVTSDRTDGGVFALDTSLFSDYGFASTDIVASAPALSADRSENSITIAPNTALTLSANSLLANADMALSGSAADVFGVTHLGSLPLYLRPAEQLTLNADSVAGPDGLIETGALLVSAGASITADPKSSITLESMGTLEFAGSIVDPDGSVSLHTQNLGNYYPAERIQLDRTASIDVSGEPIYQPTSTGLLQGSVLGGGSISIVASSGSLVTDPGSLLNFSGTAAPLDVQSLFSTQAPQRETVPSAGGSLSLIASESISLQGTVKGAAGVGNGGVAEGGTLTIALSRLGNVSGFAPEDGIYPTAPRELEVIANSSPIVQASSSGMGIVDPNMIAASGVDSLNLIADGSIAFGNGVNLNLPQSLILNSPVLSLVNGASATLSAGYVAIGTGTNTYMAAGVSGAGSGTLNISAGSIDLIGNSAIQGAASTTLSSRGQIQLRGDEDPTSAIDAGSLQVAGTLTLNAVDVLPATGVQFSITAAGGIDNTISLQQVGALTGIPLSAAGQVTLSADNIVQAGTLVAPFGQITLNANNNLTLAPGSITSVSAGGSAIPYGRVDNGDAWYYGVLDNNNGSLTNSIAQSVTAVPTRQVTLNGASVTIAPGATVNVSGGGNLTAYQFTPGTGGSVDVLGNGNTPNANSSQLFAVLPSVSLGSVPYDAFAYAGSGVTPGETVYLGAGSGLPAGYYAVLPARYALLPGAYLISETASVSNVQSGAAITAPNGAAVVAGYFSFGSSGSGSAQPVAFTVEPGSYTNTLGDYATVSASNFFAPTSTPGTRTIDGGTLSISDVSALNATGSVLTQAATGGINAAIDLSAPALQIDAGSVVSGADGVSHLSAATLNGWAPGSILLGGVRQSDGTVQVGAQTVEIGAGSTLTSGEILAVANEAITVDAGAVLQTNSAAQGVTAASASLATATPLMLSGDGSAGAAVLAVSDLNSYLVTRAGPLGSNPGTVDLAAGSTVASRGSLTLDAPGGALLSSGSLSGTNAFWYLGGSDVVFAESAPQGAVAIDSALVTQLGAARGVNISSTASIGILEAVQLGSSSLADISLSAPAIVGNGASATFTAGKITLGNAQASSSDALVAGAGGLELNASEIDLASGQMGLGGFDTVTLNAGNRIVGTSTSSGGAGGIAVAGELDIVSPLLTGTSGSMTNLSANGNLSLTAPVGAAAPTSSGLSTGGTLLLTASTLDDAGTQILMPSGVVSMTGTAGLTLGAGSIVDVAGLLPSGSGIAHGSSGGLIVLASQSGNVNLASGATLNVSGASGADAGDIDVSAFGVANIQGTLLGSADSGQQGGSFSLRAGTLSGFAALNQVLEAGGFDEARSIQVLSGDLDLAAGSTLTARNVLLSTDTGNIDVAGRIDSSGAGERGSIELDAGGGLVIESSAALLSNGTDTSTRAGNILLSTNGTLNLGANADIEAQSAGGDGILTLRAPATGGDVAIASLPTRLDRLGGVNVEPAFVTVLTSGAPSTADLQTEATQVADFFTANAGAISARLGLANVANAVLAPFIEFQYNGDLTLPALDLSSWRFNGNPGDIAFAATGNLTVGASITDGFTAARLNGRSYLQPATAASSAITLVAGADLGGARVAEVTGAAADLTVDPGVLVRTGTGDIILSAAEDVVIGAGATVYTGGEAAAPTANKRGSAIVQTFLENGGDLFVTAGRDVVGAPLATAQQVTDWAPAVSGANGASWGIEAENFTWNFGALGGGGVRIDAGRDVLNVSAAAADSAVAGAGGITEFGGGNLTVSSGRDIDSAYLYEGLGTMRLTAFGSLGTSQLDSNGLPVNSLLVGGDASFIVRSVGTLNLADIAPATVINNPNEQTFFFRTSAASYERLESDGGDLDLNATASGLATFLGNVAAEGSDSFNIGTASIDLAAFGGNISLQNLTAFPSARGQLSVYAAGNITGEQLGMYDTPAIEIATPLTPVTSLGTQLVELSDPGAIHTGDPQTATVTAGGDITNLFLVFPKAVSVRAGRDILDVSLLGQNVNDTDTTLMSAGRDITDTFATVGGGGSVDILAGRNIDFGVTQGATTVGNLIDPNLATTTGADLTIIAGLSTALGGTQFLSSIVAPSSAYQQQLVNYVENATDTTGLNFTQALGQFTSFSALQQQPFLLDVFFSELLASGRAANNGTGTGFAQGYAAIDALFAGSRGASNPYSGNITLPFSGIYTLDGGTIDILLPGGSLDVGLANPPAGSLTTKSASQLGIVTEKPGDINIYSSGDVLVNTSRIFTLDGGNILIWSTNGSIDAGRGARSSVSAAPPLTTVSASGAVSVDFTNTVAGSGIQTIQTVVGVTPGNVDLDAPNGTVNAGQAGISSAGNLNIAAQSVVNIGNISVGGTSTGVPPEVSGLGVSVAAAASAGSASSASQTNSAANADSQGSKEAPLAQAALSWLEVFVTGLGEENCRPDDMDCLRRQKKN